MNFHKAIFLIGIIINIYYLSFQIILSHKEIDRKRLKYFDYISYDNYYITDEMKNKSGWMFTSPSQYYLINGIIRKLKPKNCLEVGVARGGGSILILNAIKDIKNSRLVSLDLNKNLYFNRSYLTGYRVKKYFPELTNKWQLFTGEQPHIFLQKLKIKFDFVFLDTAHISPGEIINIIEILPFLNENAIIILHDIMLHFSKESIREKIQSVSSPQLLLMSVLQGEKIVIKNSKGIDNMGVIFLYRNQKEHYLDYFLLLLSFWDYIPSEKQSNEIRTFIQKYYNSELYLSIFDIALKNNYKYVNKIKKFIHNK